MKTIKMTIITLVTVFSLFSCKKDAEKTTAEKIEGRWNLSASLSREVVPPNTNLSSAKTGVPGEYFDFRTDGKVYCKMDGYPEESESYHVDSDSQITIAGVPFVIQQLDDNKFVIYSKQILQISNDAYTEDTYTLTR